MANFISQEVYDSLIESKKNKEYNNHICGIKCGLEKTKQFEVKGTQLKLEMRCTQQGGMWSGSYCFVVC
jgi:hypothetical protein